MTKSPDIAGTSYTAPHHLPFKDGLSWAAYEFLSQQHDRRQRGEPAPYNYVTVLPVGITYTTKDKWRSDVIVQYVFALTSSISDPKHLPVLNRYAEPITVNEEDRRRFLDDSKATVKALTSRITEAIEQSTINAPDW
jgi:glycerol-3-phosphate O-acyltransferase/dihydroxyacetone phosphate acyltransferase